MKDIIIQGDGIISVLPTYVPPTVPFSNMNDELGGGGGGGDD